MRNMQRIGAISAFVLAIAYLVGIVMALTILDTQAMDPLEKIAFQAENWWTYYAWITLIYVVAGVCLIPLSLGVRERIKQASEDANPLVELGAVFGIAWAVLIMGSGLLYNSGLLEMVKIYENDPQKAIEFWHIIRTVHNGIGAEVEVPGGIWTLLVGIAALKSGGFPKWMNILALVTGAAGILTVIPPLTDSIVAVYALGHIIWWTGMGIHMLKDPERASKLR